MKKIKISVTGRVQGVGFRHMTKVTADRLGIQGFAKNTADGSVYIEAAGKPESIAEFIEAVKKSPAPMGKVVGFSVEETEDIESIKGFKVR